MAQTFLQIDAFTDRPFAGNPAAVFILETAKDDAWCQAVAREMALSETAFLVPEGEGHRLRWFTPEAEVDLCGHATLASAHALFESGAAPPDGILRFRTRSGELRARRLEDWIELDFPSTPPEACPLPEGLSAALGLEPSWTGKTPFDFFVEAASAAEILALKPDFGRIKALTGRGVIVTAASEDDAWDFISRFFAPAVGIDEDPVTGSAHCALGPFWKMKTGRSAFAAHQASARGGDLRVRVAGERCFLLGQAVTVFEGALRPAARE